MAIVCNLDEYLGPEAFRSKVGAPRRTRPCPATGKRCNYKGCVQSHRCFRQDTGGQAPPKEAG